MCTYMHRESGIDIHVNILMYMHMYVVAYLCSC